MAISAGILGLTSIVAAVLPALAVSGLEPHEVIRAGGRGLTGDRSEGRIGRGLIVFQVALATVLVTSTALLMRSYQSLNSAELGFRTERMLRVALFVNANDAPDMSDVPAVQDRALEAVAGVEGVEAVGRIWPTAPLVAAPQSAIRYPGMDERRRDTGENVSVFAADPGLLDVLEIPLLAGRGITGADHIEAEPVAVISASLAERMGGPERAVGTVVSALGADRRVVGVTANAGLTGPRAPTYEALQLFVPLAQFPNRTVSFAIRTVGQEPDAVLPSVRRALARVAPASALDWTDTFEAALGASFERDRFLVALSGVFSIATLLLASLGLLALLSYSVARARFEIGIRQALGATRLRIVGGVVRRALGLVGAGLGIGLVLSVAATRLLGGLLYGVGALDPVAFAFTAAVLIGGALLASAGPASSAARVPPATVLRGD
jgi:predicted permease